KDPVLNTFIYHEDFDLAETLFHELAHQRVFVSGDTDFNEAFATAVAEEGVHRWLAAKSDPVATEKYRAEIKRKDKYVQLVMRARQQLEMLYASNAPPTLNPQSDSSNRKGATELARRPNQAEEVSARSDLERERTEKQIIIAQLRRDYEQLKA